jgi:hypothetical protein
MGLVSRVLPSHLFGGLELMLPDHETAQALKDFAQFIALSAAALFFFYKLLNGYLFPELTLRISCTRQASKTPARDALSVVVFLKKGPNGALTLHDAAARVTCPAGGQICETKRLEGFRRLSSKRCAASTMAITWQDATSVPCLNIAPGDETHFATVFDVPAEVVCIVEVAILGRRLFSPARSQWRASEVSLRLTPVAPIAGLDGLS